MTDDPLVRHVLKKKHRHRYDHGHENISPFAELKPGQERVIATVQGNQNGVRRLADLALTPRTAICVLKAAPSLLYHVGWFMGNVF